MAEQELTIIERAIANQKNRHEDFLQTCGKILEAVAKFIKDVTEAVAEPFEKCFKGLDEDATTCLLCIFCWFWIPLTFFYGFVVFAIFGAFFLPMAFVVLVKSVIFLMIGIWPFFFLTFAATATTIYRYYLSSKNKCVPFLPINVDSTISS